MASRKRMKDERKAQQRRERREPFATVTSKGVKRTVGRTTSRKTPLHIRALDMELEEGLRDYIRQRVGFNLGKFGLEVARVSVRFHRLASAQSGPTYECRFKVVLYSTAEVALSATGETQRTAFDNAANRISRAVRKDLDRRRTVQRRPRRPRAV